MPSVPLEKLRKLASPRNWPAYAYRARNRLGRKLSGNTYILIERKAGIGGIICTFPGVLALREQHPNSHIVYATNKDFAPVVRMGKCADTVIELDENNPRPWTAHSDFDLIFHPRLGDEYVPPRLCVGHLVDDFSKELGVKPGNRQPRMYPPEELATKFGEQIKQAKNSKKLAVGIHTGPSWPVREWLPAQWDQLQISLEEKIGACVIQLGTDVDTARGPVKAPRISGAIDWVNRFSLEETAAVISQLDLFIGIDSGLLHIAGAVGTRSVGLFGAINPAFRLPPITPTVGVTSDVPCLFCHHKLPAGHWRTGCPNDIICMKQLTADRVLNACISVMESKAG